jgi:hypothetical protein
VKRPGHCTLCEEPVFKFDGEKPSFPLESAWRVNFLLTDDTSADITFCEECLMGLSENLEKVWEICLERFDYEERHRDEPSPEADAVIAHLKEQHLVRIQSETRWDALYG